MRTKVVTTDWETGERVVCPDVVDSLEANGTYLPDVKRVVYSLKTTEKVKVLNEDGSEKKVPAVNRDGSELKTRKGETVEKNVWETRKLDRPILVTKVWWADGTSTTVRNSYADRVETEEVELEDGTKVEVATETAKTYGLMAAVVKRTCGVPDENGEMVDTNLGKVVAQIIKASRDQQLDDAKAKIAKSKAKKAAQEKANASGAKKGKAKRYSGRKLAELAGPILEALAKKVAENPGALDSLLKA